MHLLRKKKAGPVMLFGNPFVGIELGRRIALRQERRERLARVDWMLNDFCSRRECPAGDGGEKKAELVCPGSPVAAAGILAGAGCETLEGAR
jgi:hypothetical protein